MKIKYFLTSIIFIILAFLIFSCGKKEPAERSALDFGIRNLMTYTMSFPINTVDLITYKGNVVLIVNTATESEFTPQYTKLQDLYIKYHDKGFEILAFPSNSFGQESKKEEDIAKFCQDNYMVSFPMFMKIDVKGPYIHLIYDFLTGPETDPNFSGEITSDFEKFLLDKTGKIIGRFPPKMEPDDPEIIGAIEKSL